MKKEKLKKRLKSVVKFVDFVLPNSRMFWFLFTLNMVIFMIEVTTNNSRHALWVGLSTMWMWQFFLVNEMNDSRRNMVSELIEMLDRAQDINHKNAEEMMKLLDTIQKSGQVKVQIKDTKEEKLVN